MTLTLAIAGCGGMARRHLLGLEKLKGLGRLEVDLVAVADPVEAQREGLADRARELLGRRPETYASTAGLHAAHPDLDAFDVSTSPDTHEEVGVEALAASAHVMVEKPIALTVEQGLRLVRAADEAGLKLAVAENYRRDPINRLAQALVDAGALGRVFLAVQSSSGGGEKVVITPWRHRSDKGGIGLDMGVHYADVLEYLLGPIATVVGMAEVVDERRIDERGVWHPADAEDLVVGAARFESGVLANLLLSHAGRGEGHFHRSLYGTAGTLAIPPDRTGSPLKLVLRRDGQDVEVPEADLLDLVPDFTLDRTTADLFGGVRLPSYDLPWADIDANLLAVEFDDFAGAILDDRPPEVSGHDGLRSLTVMLAFFESQNLGRAVDVEAFLRSGRA